MRVLILAMIFLMCEVFAMAETAYVILPTGIVSESVIAIGKDGKKASVSISEGENYYEKTENGVKVVIAKLHKITANSGDKVVIRYKDTATNKYVLLASEEVNVADTVETIKSNYDNEVSEDSPDFFNIIKLDDYKTTEPDKYDYDLFPGHIVEEGSVFSALRIGEEISLNEGPSNVVLKFFTEVTGGYTLSGEVNISPNNAADKNNSLKVESSIGDIYYFEKENKGEGGTDTIENYYGKTPNIVREIDGVTYLRFRIKSGELELNDEPVNLDDKKYILKSEKGFKVLLENRGKNNLVPAKWYFEIVGNDVTIDPLPDEAPTTGKTEDNQVYVIKAESLSYEGSVKMTSGKEQKRNRSSDVNIDVLNNGFEIKSIKE